MVEAACELESVLASGQVEKWWGRADKKGGKTFGLQRSKERSSHVKLPTSNQAVEDFD